MSFFTDSRNVRITAHQVTMNAFSWPHAMDRGFEILCHHTTPAALYGYGESHQEPGCSPGTRIRIQNFIFKWLNDPGRSQTLWMHGPVGIGKSGIAQTVAKICASRGQLSSAFFFCRADMGRNSIDHLVPTLAYETIQRIPQTRTHICTSILSNPLIFKASLIRQIQAIIVQSLEELSNYIPPPRNPSPMLIIIDGLDECTEKASQALIIQSFLSQMASMSTSSAHKLLIVSRPESQITAAFSPAGTCVEHLRLDPWGTQDDICTFLRKELRTIRSTHPLHKFLPNVWPLPTDFDRLCTMAWGSFAYARLAIRYVSSHDRSPEESLQHMLNLRSSIDSDIYHEVDALYKHVLGTLGSDRLLFMILRLLCLHIFVGEKSIRQIARILQEDDSMVELSIKRMSSCIGLRASGTMYLYHTSFEDFLTDERRSGPYFIYSDDTARSVASAIARKWICQLDLDGVQLIQLEHCLKIPYTTERQHMIRCLWEALSIAEVGGDYVMANPLYDDIHKAWMNITALSATIQRNIKRRNIPLCLEGVVHPCALACDGSLRLWMRSQVNLFLRIGGSPDDLLSIIFDNTPYEKELPTGVIILIWVIQTDVDLLPTLQEMLPTLDASHFYLRALEPSLNSLHQSFNYISAERVIKLVTQATRTKRICRVLERFVDKGKQRCPLPGLQPWDYIFAYFSKTEMTSLGSNHFQIIVTERESYLSEFKQLAGSIDKYMRDVHEVMDIPYISKDIEATYSSNEGSPCLFNSSWNRVIFPEDKLTARRVMIVQLLGGAWRPVSGLGNN
ncbi:hypothetical protein D9619_005147 [Psilocybe cf. subviscida]|uniref:Nephrocystin 3-like N-terminal domain-containing protein n=1 Tax=Psilocybe cf. subviscida TaxID=2480587 RepID=A0A8H5BQM5_9AGAR|nr:hypothetical protein D9619_005147 [Psilocybe cf. subviscida]